MQYATGIYWRSDTVEGAACDAVLLQQVLTRRGRVLMAAVCGAKGDEEQNEEKEDIRREAAGGYMAEQLKEWFYGELLCLLQKNKRFWVLRRSLNRRLFHIQRQLEEDVETETFFAETSLAAVVLWEKTYLLWQLGDCRAYCRQGRRMKQFTSKQKMGSLRKGESILLCSDSFRRQVSGQELSDVMCMPRSAGEEQIERRLKELGGLCRMRGEERSLSAVYIKYTI